MTPMSRLNFMEEQELAVQTIAEELSRLERLVLNGERIAPEVAAIFDGCIEQGVRLQSAIRRHNSSTQQLKKMRKAGKRAAVPHRARRSELASQTR